MPAAASAAVKRPGPSRSSTATAGTFSEYCSASRAVTSPSKAAVEIGGRVVAEMPRPVVEHGLRVDDQPVERHRVDERLQRRARRAHGARHVDRAAPCGRGEIGVADIGEHVARSRLSTTIAAKVACGSSAAASRRSSASTWRCSSGSIVVRCIGASRRLVAQRRARCGAWNGIGNRRRGTGSACASASISAGDDPRARHPREDAVAGVRAPPPGCRSGRSRSGERGNATSSAASAAESCAGSLPK